MDDGDDCKQKRNPKGSTHLQQADGELWVTLRGDPNPESLMRMFNVRDGL